MSGTAATRGVVGLLVKTFPKLSETFILEEILGLERQGLKLHIYSLQRPTDEVFHAAGASVRAAVTYVASASTAGLLAALGAHCILLMKNLRRYASTVGFLLCSGENDRLSVLLQAGSLAYRLQRDGISHLHVHFVSRPTCVAELASRLAGIPYSISAHAKDIYLSSSGSLRRKLRGARFTVTCTEYNRKHLARIAGADSHVLRMYHGVDLGRFHRSNSDPRPAGPPLILSVGRLREKKGLAILIEACRRLHDCGIAFRCVIVGYGEEHGNLARLIVTLGLEDRVQLAGKMTHEELIGLYRQSAVFTLPCLIASDGDRDGIPNVLLEAMAMELAVVSTTVSGIPELIEHNVNGLLAEPADPEALADAIRRVLGEPGLARRLGVAARSTVAERFCNETNLRILRGLLAEAVRASPVAAELIYGQ